MAFPKVVLFLITLSVLFAANTARAQLASDAARLQEDPPPHEYFKRLRSPATARGVIGGESHDGYVIHARKGQTMSVRISWRPDSSDDEKYDTNAHFSVNSRPVFSGDGTVKGKESHKGSRWTGTIPRTGNYYIFVVGYPTVRYTLRVTVQ